MVTKVQRRRPVSDFFQKAQMYLLHRHEVRELEKPRDNEKKWLKNWLSENGVVDPESGNIRAKFTAPVDAYGTKTYGMELRKIEGAEYFDKDEVFDYLSARNLAEITNVFRTVEVVEFDQDELYVLQQEGKISEKDLRKLLHTNDPTYQLWPVESPFSEDEDV